jgi:uncharacterized membrane-anchored protein
MTSAEQLEKIRERLDFGYRGNTLEDALWDVRDLLNAYTIAERDFQAFFSESRFFERRVLEEMDKREKVEAILAQLPALLIELQAASWSRSWTRVLKARERVKELTGIEVSGPLKASLKAIEKA